MATLSTRPWVGISLMPEEQFMAAALPLFQAGTIEAIEWTLDFGFGDQESKWCSALLDDYASAGRLFGHGVAYSPLSGTFAAQQGEWLEEAARACRRRRYRQVSEHFGFMRATNFAFAAPLPVPHTRGAVAVGRDRLARMRDACGVHVGLENLALSFAASQALDQGAFLDELLGDVDGFICLDVHNLYCQLFNFDLNPTQILKTFPVARVRELHVSGGSFSTPSSARQFRRDTHDAAVPEEVFALLPQALDLFPHVEVIILERLTPSLLGPEATSELARDLERVHAILDSRAWT